MINPSTSYTIPFVAMAAGVPTAATGTPTAVVWRNGSAEATSVTVSTTSNTGIYHAAFTTGEDWEKTDRIWLVVSATISGTAYKGIAWDSFSEPDAVMRGTDGANTTTPPTAAAVALTVAQYDQRQQDGTAGTIGWYFKKLRQANLAIEATVTADVTATTKTFSVNLTTYPTGAFRHAVMTVVEDSVILEQNSPIETFTNNTTFSTIALEEELTAAPQPGDVIVIAANSHVHSIASIVSGVWSALTSGFSIAGSAGEVVKALGSMLEFVSGIWRWKSSSLTQAPSGSSTVTVLPASGIAAGRGETTSLVAYVGETISQSIGVYQADGTTAYDLSGKTLTIIFENLKTGDDVAVVASGSITISGASNNTVTFAYPLAATASQRELAWVLRDEAVPKTVYLRGTLEVRYAPTVG